jgi:hypothetical protein
MTKTYRITWTENVDYYALVEAESADEALAMLNDGQVDGEEVCSEVDGNSVFASEEEEDEQ